MINQENNRRSHRSGTLRNAVAFEIERDLPWWNGHLIRVLEADFQDPDVVLPQMVGIVNLHTRAIDDI